MASQTRKIIHLDLDAFFCAVEELRNPALKGKPFAVGGSPEGRGVVASCSYAARQFKVHSAMPMSRALALCPDLIIVRSTYGAYRDASEEVMAILQSYSPLVEQLSIDEAFVDVSDLQQPGIEIGRQMQNRINQELHLPCSLGVASNKLIAKIANNVAKAAHKGVTPPNAILEVPAGQEAEFLKDLPTEALWGVGPKTAERLSQLGIHTIGELASFPEVRLSKLFGKMGHELSVHARGIDNRMVITEHDVKSISQETTFSSDKADEIFLKRTICNLAEQVGYRLRHKGLCASTVRIKFRLADFSTFTRQVTLARPTDQDSQICDSAVDLFQRIWKKGQMVRLLGVGVSGLSECVHQLSLWDNSQEKERKLLTAMDQLRERYGKDAILRGHSLRKKKGR